MPMRERSYHAPSPMRLRRAKFLLLAALPVLPGCLAPVTHETPRRPWTSLQQMLGLDLSAAGFAGRAHRLERIGHALSSELARAPRLARAPTALLHRATSDATHAPHRAYSLLAAELSRAPSWPAALRPGAALDGFARRLADDLAAMPVYLGFAHAPLDERDDLRHRTDPHDDRPERGWWARIARRLDL